jgi:hypothetical protein
VSSLQKQTFLVAVALVKLGEYFYQLPRMTDPFQDVETVKHVLVGSAVFAGVSWCAPKLKWKKNL